MWHAVDPFWVWFHALPKPVYMIVELSLLWIGFLSVCGVVMRRFSRHQAILVRMWYIPVGVGVLALVAGVTHDVWEFAQGSGWSAHTWPAIGGAYRTLIGAYLIAFAAVVLFLRDRGGFAGGHRG